MGGGGVGRVGGGGGPGGAIWGGGGGGSRTQTEETAHPWTHVKQGDFLSRTREKDSSTKSTIDLQFRAPLTKFIFFLRKMFCCGWVSGCVGVGVGG